MSRIVPVKSVTVIHEQRERNKRKGKEVGTHLSNVRQTEQIANERQLTEERQDDREEISAHTQSKLASSSRTAYEAEE